MRRSSTAWIAEKTKQEWAYEAERLREVLQKMLDMNLSMDKDSVDESEYNQILEEAKKVLGNGIK